MRNKLRISLLSTILFTILSMNTVNSQDYSLVGDASDIGGDCFQLTPATQNNVGAVWSNVPLYLNQDFSITARIDIGTPSSSIADGIGFVLQTEGTSAIGDNGGNIGIGGASVIAPSVAAVFRSWTHERLEFWGDGNISSPLVSSPTSYSLNGLSSGYHTVVINWDAILNELTIDVDDDGIDITLTNDIVANFFSGNPRVYWGFTGATGNFVQAHQVCIDEAIFASSIPTLGQWGLISLGLFMVVFGIVYIRQSIPLIKI